ncbi:Alpha/Beta hydrolase protein [Bisporella sp. PMI_857]|nr:Alpha/Beta hydrolase protein [Bisporella sp. PMI_857]
MFSYLVILLCFHFATIVAKEDTAHTRKYFYIGGEYVTDTTGNHVLTNHMYVEELTPVGGSAKLFPLVFVHGVGQTGTNWLNKPDGGPGWASYFLGHGYKVYLLDIPVRGRSPYSQPQSQNSIGSPSMITAEAIEQKFTAPEKHNNYPGAELHTQWPGNGSRGDPVFEAYYASTAPSLMNVTLQQTIDRGAGIKLLDRIGKKVILIGHSRGGVLPWLLADSRPDLVESIVALEPAGPPFREPNSSGHVPARKWGVSDVPLTYLPPVTNPDVDIVKKVLPTQPGSDEECVVQADNPPPRQLAKLKNLKVVIVTAEASWHPAYDWCTVTFLQQAGVNASLVLLNKLGIKGNGHMFFLENNSDEIAEVVREWIEA